MIRFYNKVHLWVTSWDLFHFLTFLNFIYKKNLKQTCNFQERLLRHGLRKSAIGIPFEDVVFSIKKQLAGWSSLLSARAWNVSGRLQYNTAARATPSLPALIEPTNLNEMCCCVDSRGRWPLSRSKHLSEIGWNWYNPGRGIITPAWDLLCHVANFIRPGRALFMFLWQPHRFFFLFFFPAPSYLFGLSGGSGRAPSGDGALIVRTLKKTHKRIALTQRPVSCNMRARTRARAHTHSKRTSYTALAISISPH